MVTFADYNPEGATRTSKTGRIRLTPQTPNYFNQKWFKDFMSDFQWKNSMENNGVISGCVISDGGSNSIDCTSGEVYINGTKYTISTPANFPTPGDGWYIAYAKTDLSVVYGRMENDDVQSALTPDDAVFLGYAVRGESAFFVKPFVNEVGDIATLQIDIDSRMAKSQNLNDVADKSDSRSNLDVYSKTEIDTAKMAKSQNLNDLADKPTARTNLDVYSKTQSDNGVSTHAAVTSTHGASGDLVGQDNTQTITNKTVDGASNTITKVDSVKDQGGISASGLKIKIVEIGDWNMDATPSVSVAHGIGSSNKIKMIDVMIRGDSGSIKYRLTSMDTSFDLAEGDINAISDTTINLSRRASPGLFDSTDYDSTSFNRGWITIWYEA